MNHLKIVFQMLLCNINMRMHKHEWLWILLEVEKQKKREDDEDYWWRDEMMRWRWCMFWLKTNYHIIMIRISFYIIYSHNNRRCNKREDETEVKLMIWDDFLEKRRCGRNSWREEWTHQSDCDRQQMLWQEMREESKHYSFWKEKIRELDSHHDYDLFSPVIPIPFRLLLIIIIITHDSPVSPSLNLSCPPLKTTYTNDNKHEW